jgi:hypothetical protein
MPPDIDKIEAIMRQHWEIPSHLSSAKLLEHAGRIQVLIKQKYSHENLKYQLRLLQTNRLKQDFNDQACDQIATDLLNLAK